MSGPEYCTTCRGQGIVWAKLPESEECKGYFVFLCGCQWGRADRRAYPRWNSMFSKTYLVDHKSGDPDPKPLDTTAPLVRSMNVLPYSPKTNLPAFNDGEDDLF